MKTDKQIMKEVLKIICGGIFCMFIVLFLIGIAVNSGGEVEEQNNASIQAEAVNDNKAEEVKQAKEVEQKSKQELYVKELAYIAFIDNKNASAKESMSDIAELFQNPLFLDDEWKSKIAIPMANIKKISEDINAYKDVPPMYSTIHELVVKAYDSYSKSMDYMALGIDYSDTEKMDKAISFMEDGTRLINHAADEIDSATDELNAK